MEVVIIKNEKKRISIKSVLLSLITVGTGQFYNGQIVKGTLFFFIPSVFICIYSMFNLFNSLKGLITAVVLLSAFFLYSVIDAVIFSIKRSLAKKKINKWYIYLLLILFNYFILIPFSFVNVDSHLYTSGNNSMVPVLEENEQFVANHNNKNLKRDEVVIFNAPDGKISIKRIVATSGDLFEIDKGQVFINGKPVSRNYPIIEKEYPKITIPKDSYFMLGDNTINSYDSRDYGPIQEEYIIGRALYILSEENQEGIIVFGKKIK